MFGIVKVENKSDVSSLNEQLFELTDDWFILSYSNEQFVTGYFDNIRKILETINPNIALITCDALEQVTFQSEKIIVRKIFSTDKKNYFNELKSDSFRSGWVFNKNWFSKIGGFSKNLNQFASYIDNLLSHRCSFKHISQFGVCRTVSLECDHVF